MSNADFSTQHEAAPSQIAGMLAMCAAMALLPVGDAISKTLTGFASPFDVTVWRTLAQAIWFLPILLLARKRLRGSVLSWPALLSGALVAVVSLCLISAYETMPIATAISIFFIEPLVLTLLAGPFLGEKPGLRRYIAVGIGLIGALIVIRPNFEIFGPVVLLPAVAALVYAANMIVLRRATRQHRSALSFQIGVALSSAVILGAAQLVMGLLGRETSLLSDLPGWALGALIASGGLIALTFLLITFAFSKVEASLLAPLQYLEILGATLVGYLVFGNFPDALTILGTSIILASGIYVFYRERKSGAPARKIRARVDR
jgi:drug/metabolite transporter (DMT)-like permease